MTLKSVFRKPETRMYPIAAVPELDGRRGHVAIQIEDCIFCGMCQRCCPADAITVNRDEKTWSILGLSCVQCSSCVDSCPKSCLTMEVGLPAASAVS